MGPQCHRRCGVESSRTLGGVLGCSVPILGVCGFGGGVLHVRGGSNRCDPLWQGGHCWWDGSHMAQGLSQGEGSQGAWRGGKGPGLQGSKELPPPLAAGLGQWWGAHKWGAMGLPLISSCKARPDPGRVLGHTPEEGDRRCRALAEPPQVWVVEAGTSIQQVWGAVAGPGIKPCQGFV